jgi:hypothetical protein
MMSGPRRKRYGAGLWPLDKQIAATLMYDFAVVTRNTAHFEATGARIFGVGHAQAAAHLRRLCVEREYRVCVIIAHAVQPALDLARLRFIAAMPDLRDTPAQFSES